MLSGLSFQLRPCESHIPARIDFRKVERAGAASCLIERSAQKFKLIANSRREGTLAPLAPSSVFEEAVDGRDACGRVEPLGVEVTVLEVYVSQVRQRPLRVLGLGGRMSIESSEGFDPCPERQHGQARVAIRLYNCATYRPVCDPTSPIANDDVELGPVSHRSADLMDDPIHVATRPDNVSG